MRSALLALALLAAAPAAAQTPEMQAMKACWRQPPTGDLAHDLRRCDHLLPKEIKVTDLFPTPMQRSAASDLVRYKIVLAKCPKVKPGPKASFFWDRLRYETRFGKQDPAVMRAYIEQEFRKDLPDATPMFGDWCEEALYRHGEQGNWGRDTIAMRDGSPSIRKCRVDGTCSPANTIDVYLH